MYLLIPWITAFSVILLNLHFPLPILYTYGSTFPSSCLWPKRATYVSNIWTYCPHSSEVYEAQRALWKETSSCQTGGMGWQMQLFVFLVVTTRGESCWVQNFCSSLSEMLKAGLIWEACFTVKAFCRYFDYKDFYRVKDWFFRTFQTEIITSKYLIFMYSLGGKDYYPCVLPYLRMMFTVPYLSFSLHKHWRQLTNECHGWSF